MEWANEWKLGWEVLEWRSIFLCRQSGGKFPSVR
jgi:hypothetical protein